MIHNIYKLRLLCQVITLINYIQYGTIKCNFIQIVKQIFEYKHIYIYIKML